MYSLLRSLTTAVYVPMHCKTKPHAFDHFLIHVRVVITCDIDIKMQSMSNLGNIQLPEAQLSECQELEDASYLLKSWKCIDSAATNLRTIDFNKRLVVRQSSSAMLCLLLLNVSERRKCGCIYDESTSPFQFAAFVTRQH